MQTMTDTTREVADMVRAHLMAQARRFRQDLLQPGALARATWPEQEEGTLGTVEGTGDDKGRCHGGSYYAAERRICCTPRTDPGGRFFAHRALQINSLSHVPQGLSGGTGTPGFADKKLNSCWQGIF
jgi:hypothetical protein